VKVLLDMNVVLDVLLNRAPWVSDASAVWDAHRDGRISAHLAAFSLPTIFYTLELARSQPLPDYEDNLQIACAIEAKLDAIVIRDLADFDQSPVPSMVPAELLKRLATAGPAASQPTTGA